MLALAQVARDERKRRDEKLGYFDEGMRTFHDGEKIKAVKKDIENNQNIIKKLQEQSKSRKKAYEEQMRIVSSLEYHKGVSLSLFRN